jgi:DNA repair exonuclease SbcCD ATPase subunit
LIKYNYTKIKDLQTIQEKYDLKNDKQINKYISDYKKLNNLLNKLKTAKNKDDFVENIITKLKKLNEEIKIYLKEKTTIQKQKAKKYAKIYEKKLKKVTKKINNIITNIAKILIKKEHYNSKDKQIINILYLIKQKLNNLENLSSKTFFSRKDLNKYILDNFNQIKAHFRQIRKIAE